MKTKCMLPLLLMMLIFFTACGGGTSNYWKDWIKDVPNGGFEQTDSEIFVMEQNGYSIEFTLEKWLATRGSSEYVLHPANSEIPLPLLKSSDCVIPFVLTAKTATKDSSFETNYYLSVYAVAYTEHGVTANHHAYSSYGCGLSQFEVRVEDLTRYFDGTKPHEKGFVQELMPQWHNQMWPQSFSGNFSETKIGDEQVIFGCYVIKDYYSPEFPDGNLALFPDGYAMMRVLMGTTTAQVAEEFDVVMR